MYVHPYVTLFQRHALHLVKTKNGRNKRRNKVIIKIIPENDIERANIQAVEHILLVLYINIEVLL